MNIQQVEALIQQGESTTVEFKTSTSQLKPAFETIAAFLNGQGGTVLIGVNNKGQIVGQDMTDNTRQEIAREISKFEPAPPIDIDTISVKENKQIVTLQVKSGAHIPYIYDGRAFQRNQSTTIRMSQHRYEQLLIERGQLNYAWEDLPAVGYDLKDLDRGEIRRLIQDGIRVNRIPAQAAKDSIKQALQRLNLLKGEKLKNAAVILFGKKVFPDYAQCSLKLGRFQGTNNLGDFIDNQQVHGNIFQILKEADFFVRRHLPIASFFQTDQFERIDEPKLPALAVREAMVNAVCHKDYNEQVTSITLAIFDDRLEIWNYGALSPKLKLSDLKKKHISCPRNKVISDALYSREFFEKWGTGTNKMIDLCREVGAPSPEFSEYCGGFCITFRFKEPMATTIRKKIEKKSLNSRQKAILKIIKENNGANIKLLIDKLENPPSRRMVSRDLHDLKKQNFIELKGSTNKALWVLKGEII